MGRKVDLTGQKINRFLFLSQAEHHKAPDGRLYVMWNCLCDCGKPSRVRSSALTSKKKSISCGCFSAESTAERVSTHRQSQSRIYTSYMAMKKRCTNPNDPHFHNYGGRGITVCGRWLESFENFYADMGERPEGKTLDRIKNDLGYSPENCKWSTRKEQQLNRRHTGKTSVFRGVSWSTLYNCFKAQVRFNGKNKFIGNFKSEEEAALAFNGFVIKNNLPNMINHSIEARRMEGGKKC